MMQTGTRSSARKSPKFTLPRAIQRGAALVIVLAFVALLTVVVVAYFMRTRTDIRLSSSSVNLSKTEELARSAMDLITSDLKQEIVAGSMAPATNSVYRPRLPATLNPADQGFVRNTDPSLDQLPNLLKKSTRNAPFYSGTGYDVTTYPPSDRAAQSSTGSPSFNGRAIPLASWNKPLLLAKANPSDNEDVTPVADFTAPDWILVAPNGSNPKVWPSDGSLIWKRSSDTAVIGRFAYVIYDEGGLLDLNVAGFPAAMPLNDLHPNSDGIKKFGYGGKGPVSFADLRQLGLTDEQVNNLLGWRNYATAEPSGDPASGFNFSNGSLAKYFDSVTANPSGFIKVRSTTRNGQTDQAVLSRQQLLALQKRIGFDQNILRFLGNFSREVNAPTWRPMVDAQTGFAYKTNAANDSSVNRDILTVRVTKPFERSDGALAKTGEPLVANRFPLSRLALLSYSATSSGTDSKIWKYFGLSRSLASDPWRYTNSDGTVANRIKNLKEVADEGREPNFFELLYSVILNGSLGVYNPTGLSASQLSQQTFQKFVDAIDGNAFLQTMRIGANIIDQADSDNYPTIISYDIFKVYGIEDIPYPNKLLWKFVSCVPGQTVPYSNPNWWDQINGQVFFEMWNPHQQISSGTAVGPTEFRVIVDPSLPVSPTYTMRLIEIRNGTGGGSSQMFTNMPYANPAPGNPGTFPSPYPVVKFNWASPASYREPTVVVQDSATTAGDSSILTFPTTGAKALGYTFPGPRMIPFDPAVDNPMNSSDPEISPKRRVEFLMRPNRMSVPPNTPYPGYPSRSNWYLVFGLVNANFLFQFKDSSNTWQTYASFGGMEGQLSASLRSAATQQNMTYNLSDYTSPYNNKPECRLDSLDGLPFIKSDPRTPRFGLSKGEWDLANTSGRFQETPSPTFVNGTLRRSDNDTIYASAQSPWGSGKFRLDWMSKNGSSTLVSTVPPLQGGTWNYTDYQDVDGVIRPGDSYLSVNNEPMASGSGANAVRPVVLNRPFRSVGELGYVFRDMPWKTLDLFSDKSADGGLLDIFCIEENVPVVAGRTKLNTRNIEVLKAILAGTMTKEVAGESLTPAEAETVAQTLAASNIASGPMLNLADLPARLGVNLITAVPSKNKIEREAVVRALASSTSVRTWNLMIDVIVQSGKYPVNARSLDDFLVEGSRRYWLHVAIDRFTGKIVDKQLERVDE